MIYHQDDVEIKALTWETNWLHKITTRITTINIT